MLESAIGIFVFILLIIAIIVAKSRSGAWPSDPTDVLIMAAHQDDCIILAGDYAVWAARAGNAVRILYLTCGDDSVNSDRARERRDEAIAAWGIVGVSKDDFHFLNYPQSPLGQACRMTLQQREDAASEIEKIVRETKSGTAIFLPAEGEDHPDHRALREIGLYAVRRSERNDLLVLEAPEYNAFYSFSGSPKKVALYLFKSLPIISSLLPSPRCPPFPGFIRSGKSYHISASPDVRSTKVKILRGFASENSDLLESFFDWRNEFRIVDPNTATPSRKPLYLTVRTKKLSPLVLVFWIGFYQLSFACAWVLSSSTPSGVGSAVLLLLLSIALLWKATRPRRSLEVGLLYLMVGCALVLRAFALSGWSH